MNPTDPAYREARAALLWANGYAAGIKCAADALADLETLPRMLYRAEQHAAELETELASLRAVVPV